MMDKIRNQNTRGKTVKLPVITPALAKLMAQAEKWHANDALRCHDANIRRRGLMEYAARRFNEAAAVTNAAIYADAVTTITRLPPHAVANMHPFVDAIMAIHAEINPPICATLAEINGKATSHTTQTAFDLRTIASRAEAKMIAAGIPLDRRVGTIVTHTAAGPRPTYKYNTIGTTVTLRRGTRGTWYLIDVARTDLYPKQAERLTITITSGAAEIVRAHAMAPFSEVVAFAPLATTA
jgi:hypothetical protein